MLQLDQHVSSNDTLHQDLIVTWMWNGIYTVCEFPLICYTPIYMISLLSDKVLSFNEALMNYKDEWL